MCSTLVVRLSMVSIRAAMQHMRREGLKPHLLQFYAMMHAYELSGNVFMATIPGFEVRESCSAMKCPGHLPYRVRCVTVCRHAHIWHVCIPM